MPTGAAGAVSSPAAEHQRGRIPVYPGRRNERSEKAQYDAWEQACRQRWRALLLVVKAKLEAIETGIATFDGEFMANIVLPGGGTVGDWMTPQIERAYLTGAVPAMLPMLGEGERS